MPLRRRRLNGRACNFPVSSADLYRLITKEHGMHMQTRNMASPLSVITGTTIP